MQQSVATATAAATTTTTSTETSKPESPTPSSPTSSSVSPGSPKLTSSQLMSRASPPLQARSVPAVSAAAFTDLLHAFMGLDLSKLTRDEILDQVRKLVDMLDALTDRLPLRVNEKLFTALTKPQILQALTVVLQDVSVQSTPYANIDVLRQYRYPYVVGNILSVSKLADAFLASPPLLDNVLELLDAPAEAPASHPVVVAHVVNVLVAYLEYNPEALLDRLAARPSFLPAVVRQLHFGAVTELMTSLISSRCVEAVLNMDLAAVCFEESLEQALRLLANTQCFHLLAMAYAEAAEKAVRALSERPVHSAERSTPDTDEANGALESKCASCPSEDPLHSAEQHTYNISEVFLTLVERTVRVVRVDTRSLECTYLNVFANPTTSKTLGHILDAGVAAYEKTQGRVVNPLLTAITLVTRILKTVEWDRSKRVASVAGQPPPVCVSALSEEVAGRLTELTLIATGRFLGDRKVPVSARIRMHILELFATCQRVCPPQIFSVLDRLRYGEVAFKLLLIHDRNSMVHGTVIRAVESALLSDSASLESRRHWLVNSRLVDKILRTWRKERGSEKWKTPKDAQETPLLSAIVHMACCVQHWIAFCHARTSPGERGVARALIGDTAIDAFNDFCNDCLQSIVSEEKRPLGGDRPQRSRPAALRGVLRGSLSMSDATCGDSLRRSRSWSEDVATTWSSSENGVHLVRSLSAHRFGYVEPSTPRTRSRIADIFDSDERSDDGSGSDFGLSFLNTMAYITATSEARHGGDNATSSSDRSPSPRGSTAS